MMAASSSVILHAAAWTPMLRGGTAEAFLIFIHVSGEDDCLMAVRDFFMLVYLKWLTFTQLSSALRPEVSYATTSKLLP